MVVVLVVRAVEVSVMDSVAVLICVEVVGVTETVTVAVVMGVSAVMVVGWTPTHEQALE